MLLRLNKTGSERWSIKISRRVTRHDNVYWSKGVSKERTFPALSCDCIKGDLYDCQYKLSCTFYKTN